MADYTVVETTKLTGDCYSFQFNADIENGGLVTKGDLVSDELEIYNAALPATATLKTEPVYLITQPAWTYDDNKTVDKNEENYINPKNRSFRVQKPLPTNRFKISDTGIEKIDDNTALAVGQFVGLAEGTSKPKASAATPTDSAFVGKIIDVTDVGFAYSVGQAGNVGAVTKKVLIEVVKNG